MYSHMYEIYMYLYTYFRNYKFTLIVLIPMHFHRFLVFHHSIFVYSYFLSGNPDFYFVQFCNTIQPRVTSPIQLQYATIAYFKKNCLQRKTIDVSLKISIIIQINLPELDFI